MPFWRLAAARVRPRGRAVATAAATKDAWTSVTAAAAAAPARRPRLYVPSLAGAVAGGSFTLDDGESRHARSLRLAPGAPVELCDGRGGVAAGEFAAPLPSGRRAAAGALVTLTAPPRVLPPDSGRPAWTLAVAGVAGGLKGGRGDWVVEKAAELGAAAVVPLATARAPAPSSSSDGRADRWARLAHAASKQCLRVRSLDVRPAATLSDLLPAIAAAPLALVAAAGGVPVLDALTEETLSPAGGRECWLLVGPEGDWAPEELAALRDAGAVPVGLGDSRLRVETACLALLTAAMLR